MAAGLQVKDIMTKFVIMITPNDTVTSGAEKMTKAKICSLIVSEKGKLAGIITDQDITRRVVAKGLNPKTTKVKDVMTKKVVSLDPETDMNDVMLTMGDHLFEHIPVVDNGLICGIVSAKDVIDVQPRFWSMVYEKRKQQKK